jgi:hypothetical protein
MRAITIKQPWATLIVLGKKRNNDGILVENRTWQVSYRGELLIHSSQRPDAKACERVGLRNLPLGEIIGVVELYDIMHRRGAAYPFDWLLRNPRQFTRGIAASGTQGVWELSPRLVSKVKPLL